MPGCPPSRASRAPDALDLVAKFRIIVRDGNVLYVCIEFGENMMKKASFAVLLLLGMTGHAGAQVVDSTCIVLFDQWRQGTGVPNPDNAYIDTCIGTSHFGEYYSTNSYELNFEWYVIHSPIDTVDTTLYFDWSDVDTTFPVIRSGSQQSILLSDILRSRNLLPILPIHHRPLTRNSFCGLIDSLMSILQWRCYRLFLT